MGIFGPKDNDVRPSEASHGQNMGTGSPTRDRDSGKDRRGETSGAGVQAKEFDALKARVANMEAFLKEKMQYDPKESYVKKGDEPADDSTTKVFERKPEPVKLPRRLANIITSDY